MLDIVQVIDYSHVLDNYNHCPILISVFMPINTSPWNKNTTKLYYSLGNKNLYF